jgi:MFS family permease
MPSYLNRNFGMSLSMAGLNATFWLQIASILGVISGGFLADRLARRWGGGRMLTQSFGLLLGVPFIFLTGWTHWIPLLVMAMIGFGYFKGLYDANIWASLYDVVPLRRRATALGLMNAIGWFGGGAGAVTIAALSAKYGMSASLSATSAIYLVFGSVLLIGTLALMSKPRATL